MTENNYDKVSLSDVVAIAKSVSSAIEIPDVLNVEAVTSPNETVRIDFTETGDDKGASLTGGQFSVGTRTEGHESVFGQGDSYPVELAYHYSTDNETGTTITSATDITTILQSDSGSSVDIFQSNIAGEVFLIGADQPFFGAKIKYDGLGVIEPENIQLQFLNNLDNWVNTTYMITNSSSPYQKEGWNLSTHLSEQMRFKDSILVPNLEWIARTLNINGVNVTKYWGRMVLLSPVTSLPSVQQVKQHTSRTEINSDGTVEFYGLSRGIRDVNAEDIANNNSDPSDLSVDYFTGGLDGASAKYTDNIFTGTGLYSRMLIAKAEDDIDTSTPLVVSVVYYVNGTDTGDIEFTFEYQQIIDGFLYNTAVAPDGTIKIIDSITTNSLNQRRVVRAEIPINESDPTLGGVAVTISRDARVGNINDTLSNDVIITGTNVRGRRWKI